MKEVIDNSLTEYFDFYRYDPCFNEKAKSAFLKSIVKHAQKDQKEIFSIMAVVDFDNALRNNYTLNKLEEAFREET